MDQEACLGFDEEMDEGEMDMNKPPMSAAAYLRQVRENRLQCADVVKVNIDDVLEKISKRPTKAWEGSAGLNLVDEKVSTPVSRIPSKEWREAKCREFEQNRKRIAELRSNRKAKKRKWPNVDEEESWHKLILERCEPSVQHLCEKFPNHVGTPPALSIVIDMPVRIVNEIIPYLVEWSESEGLTRPIREWLYALLLVTEFPLLPELVSALRDLAKSCRQLRIKVSEGESWEYSLFIALISGCFNQYDLRDAEQ